MAVWRPAAAPDGGDEEAAPWEEADGEDEAQGGAGDGEPGEEGVLGEEGEEGAPG